MNLKNKKLVLFLTFSVLGLLLLNLTVISAYLILVKFGDVTLNPGEKYIVNIPFIGPSKSPLICGTAQQTDGTPLKNITVIVEYTSNHSKTGEAVTGTDGEYCITLPEITTNKKFDIFIKYDNVTSSGDPLVLASNDYDLNFDNNLIFSKSFDKYAVLQGTIKNEDAEIENGRLEINLQYWPANSSERFEIFDYKKYFVNINPGEVYDVPSDELNVSWLIPSDAKIGRYKFYIKPSFNAREKTAVNVYFNITI